MTDKLGITTAIPNIVAEKPQQIPPACDIAPKKGLKTALLAIAGPSQMLLLPRVLRQADDGDLKVALLRFTNTDETYLRNLTTVCLVGR